MGQHLPGINDHLRTFIEAQHLFFVGTAAPEGRVNVSPKGMDSLRILGPNRVAWLNVTGSGNETAAHLLRSDRMTLMFCALSGPPLILRLYGQAHAIHAGEPAWAEWTALFPPLPGARQVFVLDIDLVQTSCGMAVPLMDFVADRGALSRWAQAQSPGELQAYQQRKNQRSIDGFPTGLPVTVDT